MEETPKDYADAIIADFMAVWQQSRKRLCYDIVRKLERAIRYNKVTATLDGDRFLLDFCALLLDLDKEIAMTSAYIIETYGRFFPDLRSVVHDPIDYARIAKTMGDAVNFDSDSLRADIITSKATSCGGRPLTKIELTEMMRACNNVLALDSLRKKVIAFLSRMMGLLAPNLAALVGTTVAAKLLGAAGGLMELSVMPILNIVFLGADGADASNYGGEVLFTAIDPLPGFYFLHGTKSPFKGCCLARRLLSEACRTLNKSINLAAALDLGRKDRKGEKGQAMGEEIRKLIDWLKRGEEEENSATSLLTEKQAEHSTMIGHRKLAVVKDANKFKHIVKLDKERTQHTLSGAPLERLTDSLREMGLTKSLAS